MTPFDESEILPFLLPGPGDQFAPDQDGDASCLIFRCSYRFFLLFWKIWSMDDHEMLLTLGMVYL
jgi:hypothetical protein